MRADVIQIVHGDVRRVETHVGVVSGQASLQAFDARLSWFRHLPERVRIRAAVQRIRLARPALIDEDDVARALDGAEGGADLTGELRGTLARPAGKKDE